MMHISAWRTLLVAAFTLGCGDATVTGAQGRRGPAAPPSLFDYDRDAPTGLVQTPTASPFGELTLFRISFTSPSGGSATGFLAVPKAAGPHAGVVLLHGLPGTAEAAMVNQGRDIAVRGAVVLAVDAPWARRGGLPDFTARDSAEQVQLIRDLRRAVDVLIARADVDRTRIGYVGGSYGGAMGALFVGVERRLAAAALFVGDGGLVAHFTDADGSAVGPLAEVSTSTRERWIGAMWPIEPIRFVAGAAGTPILFQNGRTDALVPAADAEALHAAAPEPKTVRWYDAGHGLTPAAREERLVWLAQRLSLSEPSFSR